MTLTRRQTRLLTLLAAGHTENQAARALDISARTARRDLVAAADTLGAATTCQAVATAAAAGLVPTRPPSGVIHVQPEGSAA